MVTARCKVSRACVKPDYPRVAPKSPTATSPSGIGSDSAWASGVEENALKTASLQAGTVMIPSPGRNAGSPPLPAYATNPRRLPSVSMIAV